MITPSNIVAGRNRCCRKLFLRAHKSDTASTKELPIRVYVHTLESSGRGLLIWSCVCRCPSVALSHAVHARLSSIADKAFTAMQFMAVLLISIAMVVFMLALFRPSSGGCCSVKTVAMVGAGLTVGFAFCQMLAFVLMIVIEKDADSE